jgi:Na+-driven multidrug efflux pump
MLTNIIGGLQGIVDHVMVGHMGRVRRECGYRRFLADLYRGDCLHLIALHGYERAGGPLRRANDPEKVDRTVYQAFLTAMGISLLVMAPIGYVLSPALLDLVNAAPP